MSDLKIIETDAFAPVTDADRIAALEARIAVLEVAVQGKALEIDAMLQDIQRTAAEINALAAGRRLAPLMNALAARRLHEVEPCEPDYADDGDETAFWQSM